MHHGNILRKVIFTILILWKMVSWHWGIRHIVCMVDCQMRRCYFPNHICQFKWKLFIQMGWYIWIIVESHVSCILSIISCFLDKNFFFLLFLFIWKAFLLFILCLFLWVSMILSWTKNWSSKLIILGVKEEMFD